MGSKRGNSDEPFKRFLPLKMSCSPTNALNILCRADCLRAVHFLREAQYLCTWVASVCQGHRDVKENEMTWNSRWLVVGVLTYMVSAAIDDTADALSLDFPDGGTLTKWEEVAKKVISRGKNDALVLVAAAPPGNTDIVTADPSTTQAIAPQRREGVYSCAEENMFAESKDDSTYHDSDNAPVHVSQSEALLVSGQNDVTNSGVSLETKMSLLSSQTEAPLVNNQNLTIGKVCCGSYKDTESPMQFPPTLNVDEYLHEGINNHETEKTTTEDEDFDNPFAGIQIVGI